MRHSFSADVREELCQSAIENRHCALAELAAFLAGGPELDSEDNRAPLLAINNHPIAGTAQVSSVYARSLGVGKQYNAEQSSLRKRFDALMRYAFPMPVPQAKILSATGVSPGETVSATVLMAACCKRAYMRGCFITGGTVNAPGRHYHLEFSFPSANGHRLAEQLAELLNGFALNAKLRSDQPLVYIKEAENIVETFLLMGANKSLLQFESEKVKKELRNDINRRINFETANMGKTISAAVLQTNDIKYIAENVGLGYLNPALEEVARLRLAYETASLHEIGEMLSPRVSKSGVNHRLRKISEIAEELRGDKDI